MASLFPPQEPSLPPSQEDDDSREGYEGEEHDGGDYPPVYEHEEEDYEYETAPRKFWGNHATMATIATSASSR